VRGGQHMRAVGALLASCLDQAVCLEAFKHPVQQKVLRPVSNKARAELRQHTETKARIGQLEPKRVLPVNAGAHGIGSLPVAQVLQELKHHDPRQAPRQGRAGPGQGKTRGSPRP